MTLVEKLWKYTALGATSIVFEEANPVLGGLAARHGRAGMIGVVIAVALGTWAASIGLYLVGRWRIEWVRRKWPSKEQLLDGALKVVRLNPWRASFAIRFAYGLRLPLPIACGAANVPFGTYAIASGTSCWLWSIAFAYLGYAFGGAALKLLMFTQRLDVKLGLAAIVLFIVLIFVMRRRLLAERTARVLTGERISMMSAEERLRARNWTRKRHEG